MREWKLINNVIRNETIPNNDVNKIEKLGQLDSKQTEKKSSIF